MPLGVRRTSILLQILAAAILLSTSSIGKAEDDKDSGNEKKTERTEAVPDTEHIFGFTEGTDIGEKGEREFENTTIGSFGKTGSYSRMFNEAALRYVVTDNLRLSVGTLADFYSIENVPGLTNRHAIGLSGLDAEARYVIYDRRTAPIGLDIGLTPQWRHTDEVSGAATESFGFEAVLAVQKDIIPDALFAALNAAYSPSLSRIGGTSLHEDDFEISVAISGVVAPNILLGWEVRHLSVADNGTFKGQALFTGPSFFTRLSDRLEAKIAWSTQIPDSPRRDLDLQNFERQQVILLFAYSF
jgi:hypothetical protein